MPGRILAISGASGSGKSSLAAALRQHLQQVWPGFRVGVLAEDSYYRDLAHLPRSARERVNFDHPSALEHGQLLTHLRQLREGLPVQVPVYDYTDHTRQPHCRPLPAADLLIVEGILLLSDPRLRREFDLRLYLDTPLAVCLARRRHRDCTSRGRSIEWVERQFATTVVPMFHQQILPTRKHADLILPGEATPQALSRQVQLELQQRGYHLTADGAGC